MERNVGAAGGGGGGGTKSCRYTRDLAVVHRRRSCRRTDIVKQWSMDETQLWFYSRSPSLDRQSFITEESDAEVICIFNEIFIMILLYWKIQGPY